MLAIFEEASYAISHLARHSGAGRNPALLFNMPLALSVRCMGYLTDWIYVEREGDAKVPSKYVEASGYRLGNWVNAQRARKDSVSIERIKRLEALNGWSWPYVRRQQQWDEWLNCLKEFIDKEGHSRVPNKYETEKGRRLGNWVNEQRARKDSMPAERRARLEALPGWVWRVK